MKGTSKAVVLNISNFEEGHNVYFGPTNGSGGFAVESASQSGNIVNNSEGSLAYKLWVDGENVQSWATITWTGEGGDDL